LVNIALGQIGVEIRAFNEAEEKLVDDLKVRPGEFEYWFIFLRIKGITSGIDRWGYGTKEVGRKLVDQS
jgi:hypothetical protein